MKPWGLVGFRYAQPNLRCYGADDDLVKDILKNKKGSIRQAPLPEGSPSWNDIDGMTYKEIKKNAQKNITGYKTIKKLLTDNRFNR